MTITTSQEKG